MPRNWWRWSTKNCRCWSIHIKLSIPTRPSCAKIANKRTIIFFTGKSATGRRPRRHFKDAEVKANVHAIFQRCHPAPLETCGCVADFNPATERLTIYLTSQAPHAHRTLFAIVGGIPENNIRVISPDIGGGFGNKVPIYPGYVCAVVASLTLSAR